MYYESPCVPLEGIDNLECGCAVVRPCHSKGLHQSCSDKLGLLAAYNRAVMEWSEAVRKLSNHPGSPDFALLMGIVNDARATTARTKTEYTAHVAEHGC